MLIFDLFLEHAYRSYMEYTPLVVMDTGQTVLLERGEFMHEMRGARGKVVKDAKPTDLRLDLVSSTCKPEDESEVISALAAVTPLYP